MLVPVARALDYAHKENIIHRDIKPANILITKSGDLMLSDFGIAKTLGTEDQTNLTGTGVGIGTPAYMAPEQGLGKEVDHRVDIYSLGVVFYEMLTGRPPYQADTPMAVMLKHINDPLPRPRQFAPVIPDQVEQVLFRALAKDPDNRYQTMAAFALDLEALSRGGEAVPQTQQGSLKTLIAIPSTPEMVEAGAQTAIASDPSRQITADSGRSPTPADSIGYPVESEPETPDWVTALGDSQTDQGTGSHARKRYRVPLLIGIVFIAALAIYAGIQAFQGSGARRQAALAPSQTPTAPQTQEALVDPTSTTLPPTPTTPPASPTPTTEPSPTPLPLILEDGYGIEMVLVPGGAFTMGASEADAISACDEWNPRNTCEAFYFKDEAPVHNLVLLDYYIDRYEVTNAAYAACVEAGECPPPFVDESYSRNSYYSDPQYADYPVVFTGWDGANAYCQWRGGRLPSEADWEKAARGTDGRAYPWGEVLDETRANFCDANCDRSWANAAYDDGYFDTAPVGSYPEGASPYGAMDMAGNVSEWVADIYNPYPGGEAEMDSNHYGSTYVRRGGSWYSLGSDLRTTRRDKDLPIIQDDGTGNFRANSQIGFRCVTDPVR